MGEENKKERVGDSIKMKGTEPLDIHNQDESDERFLEFMKLKDRYPKGGKTDN